MKYELEVQKYLRQGKTLEELTVNYFIKCNVCSSLNVVSLNYNQVYSDMSLDISQECRGLILELTTWNIVSRSFRKFYNCGEPIASSIENIFDWDSAKALVKVDGSLIEMYYYKNKWNISTRGVADADTPVANYGITFRDLVLSTMETMGFSFDELNPMLWYTFELTSPLNRIVVRYEDYNLTWLAAWDSCSGLEIDIEALPDITAPKVKEFPISNVEDLVVELEKLPPSESEGVVLRDKNFNRLKIKSKAYIEAFHVVTSVESSPRNKLEVILSEHFDDILGLLPGQLKEELLNIQKQWQTMVEAVLVVYNEHKDIENQKDFALAIKDYSFKAWLFNLRKGISIEDVISRTFLDSKIEQLNAFVGEKLL